MYAPGGATHWGYGGYQAARNDPMAIASLILGLTSFFCLGFLGGIVGIGLGFGALSRIRTQPHLYEGKGMAIAGIVLGGIQLALFVFLMAFGTFAPTLFGT